MSKKILIFDISYLTGNNRTPVISKVLIWQKKGIKVDIFCTKEAKVEYSQKLKNINYILLPFASSSSNRIVLIFENLKRNFLALFCIFKILKSSYHAFYSISAVLDLVMFPYLLKIINPKLKWVVVFDNTVEKNEPGNKYIKFLAYWFYRLSLFFLRSANTVFVVTPLLKVKLLEEGFVDSKLIITGNGVELDLIKSTKSPKKIYDGLFVGRINESKGVYDLLNVLKIICNKYPKFIMALMGRGDLDSERKFLDRAKELGLDRNIYLLGFKSGDKKIKVFKQSKIFIFLSPSESFGVALLEAVCCGLPAVVYDLKPYQYIYKNKEITKLKIGDYEGVAKKVIYLYKNKKFNNENGKKLLNRYSWDVISKIELNAIIK